MLHENGTENGRPLIYAPMKTGAVEVNWIAVAIDKVGGVKAMKKLAYCSDQTLYNWLKRGNIAHVRFEVVCRIARVSGQSLKDLTGIKDVEKLATQGEIRHSANPFVQKERKRPNDLN